MLRLKTSTKRMPQAIWQQFFQANLLALWKRHHEAHCRILQYDPDNIRSNSIFQSSVSSILRLELSELKIAILLEVIEVYSDEIRFRLLLLWLKCKRRTSLNL